MSAHSGERRVRSVTLIILGSVLGLFGLGLLAVGGTALWSDQTKRDSAGYFTGSTHRVANGSYAVTQDDLHVNYLPGWVDGGELVKIRIGATSDSGQPLFVGIARERDVNAYLQNVAHSNLRDYDVASSDQEYDAVGGTARPVPPASQHIWAASTTATHPGELKWKLREGKWSVVLMNADGSKGVAADVKLGVDVGYLGWLSSGVLAIGALVLSAAVFLVISGGRRGGRGDAATASPEPVEPVQATG
jgi:hypothetical protein